MTPAANFHTLLSRLAGRLWRLFLRIFMECRRGCYPGLTPRQREVRDLYAHGMRIADIACCLAIAPSAVRAHLKNSRSKLGLATLNRLVCTHDHLARNQDQVINVLNEALDELVEEGFIKT